ncbi:MAG: alpha/beta hydrolase [Planctomycetota bacterium]
MRADILDDDGHGPTVVYLPGIGGTGALMTPCAARLRARFRVIRLHYRPGGADSYAHLTDTALDALAAVEAGPSLLLAESFGGAIALRAALAAPQRVVALALVNSFVRYPRRGQLALTRAASALCPPGALRWLRMRVGARRALGAQERPELTATMAQRPPRFDAAYRARLRLVAELDLRRHLDGVRQPVALFAADRDRVVPSLACAREMLGLLPDADLRVLTGCSHLVLPLAELAWPEWLAALWQRVAASAHRTGGPSAPPG